jgi:hypothetical protein
LPQHRFSLSENLLELVVEPYDYSVTIGGELVSSLSCKGVSFRISRRGAVQAYNGDGQLIAATAEQEKDFEMIRVSLEKGIFDLCFGYAYMEDSYPNCDGESDRWVPAWETEHRVTFCEATDKLEIVAC